MTDDILQAEALAFKKRECVIPVRDAVIQMDDLAEDAEQLTVLARTVENDTNAYIALESYVNQFMSSVSCESWNREKATQYHRGMSGILKSMGVNIDPSFATASFEAVSVTQTKEENQAESKNKAVEFLKRIWESIKAGIAKFVEFAKSFISRVKESGQSIVDASGKLKDLIAAASGEPDLQATIEPGTWGKYIMVGDKQVGASKAVDSMRTQAVFIAGIWVESYDTASKAISALAIRKTPIPASSIWSGLNDLKNLQKPWAGAVEMKIENLPEGAPTMESMGKANIKLVPMANVGNPSLVVLNKNECNAVVTAMKSLGDSIIDAETALTKLNNDMKAIGSSNVPAANDSAAVPEALKALPGMITAAMDAPKIIYPYAAKVAQGAYRHVEESLKRYK